MKSNIFRSFLLFLLLCLILVSIFSVFYWAVYKNNIDELSYIGDPDWQRPQPLVSDIFKDNFSMITYDDYFTLFYIKKNNKTNKESLYITKNSYKGKILDKRKFIEKKSLNNFSVIKQKNSDLIHLFVISGKADSKQKLVYYQLTKSNEIKEKRVLYSPLAYTLSLKVKQNNDHFYLGLTTDKNNKYIIELFKYNFANNKLKRKTIDESNAELKLGLRYPDFNFVNQKIYLTYLRDDPAKLFTSTVDKTNKYQLCLRVLDLQFNPINKKKILDRAFVRNNNSKPIIITEPNQQNIFYHKYDLNKKQVFLNQLILDFNNNLISSKNIGDETITSLDYLKENGKYYIAYSKFHNINSHIHFTSSNQKLNNFINSKQLFAYNLSSSPKISISKKGLHVLWLETNKYDKDLYYSTNLYSRNPEFFETLGIDIRNNKAVLLVTPIYLLGLPLINVIISTPIILLAGLIFSILYFLIKKFRYNKIKNKLDNVYISYIILMLIIIGITPLISSYEIFFRPSKSINPPIPIIFLSAFIAVLIFLSKSNKLTDISPLLATGAAFLWVYWIAQINLVFSAHYYF